MMTTSDDRDRLRWLSRLLEMVPGTISWAILILPLWLSFSYPWLVAYFVLSFDFYWLCRALWFGGVVIIAFRRIRDVLAVDWSERLAGLADPGVRRAAIEARLGAAGGDLPRGALGFAAGSATGSAERRRLRRELDELRAVEALDEPPPPVGELIHLALIPTYT
jgi:hypothetical protein